MLRLIASSKYIFSLSLPKITRLKSVNQIKSYFLILPSSQLKLFSTHLINESETLDKSTNINEEAIAKIIDPLVNPKEIDSYNNTQLNLMKDFLKNDNRIEDIPNILNLFSEYLKKNPKLSLLEDDNNSTIIGLFHSFLTVISKSYKQKFTKVYIFDTEMKFESFIDLIKSFPINHYHQQHINEILLTNLLDLMIRSQDLKKVLKYMNILLSIELYQYIRVFNNNKLSVSIIKNLEILLRMNKDCQSKPQSMNIILEFCSFLRSESILIEYESILNLICQISKSEYEKLLLKYTDENHKIDETMFIDLYILYFKTACEKWYLFPQSQSLPEIFNHSIQKVFYLNNIIYCNIINIMVQTYKVIDRINQEGELAVNENYQNLNIKHDKPNDQSMRRKIDIRKEILGNIFSIYNEQLENANQLINTNPIINIKGIESLFIKDIIVLYRIIEKNILTKENLALVTFLFIEPDTRKNLNYFVRKTNLYTWDVSYVRKDTNEAYTIPSESLNFDLMRVEKLFMISRNREILRNLFHKIGDQIHLNGFLLLFLAIHHRFEGFGKFETLVSMNLKDKLERLNLLDSAEDLRRYEDILTILNDNSISKKYYAWLKGLEQITFTYINGIFNELKLRKSIVNISKIATESNGSNKAEELDKKSELNRLKVCKILINFISNKKDMIYHKNKTLEIKLNTFFEEHFNELPFLYHKSIFHNLNLTLLHCPAFYEGLKNWFIQNYHNIHLNSMINFIYRFICCDIKLPNYVHIFIYNEATKKMHHLLSFSSYVRLLSSIVLSSNVSILKRSIVINILKNMAKILENHLEDKRMLRKTKIDKMFRIIIQKIQLYHPEIYEKCFSGADLKEKLEYIFKELPYQKSHISPHSTSFHAVFVSVLKSICPLHIKIIENSYIYDMLECDIILENTKNSKKCIIELFGPSHFSLSNLDHFNVLTELTLSLKRKYADVYIVSYSEWFELSNEDRLEFVKWKLNDFFNSLPNA